MSVDADGALLHGDVDTTLSAHEMLDSSARTFAEQRDQVLAHGAGCAPHGSHVHDSDVVEHSLGVGDGSECALADEMIGAETASLGWYDLNQ